MTGYAGILADAQSVVTGDVYPAEKLQKLCDLLVDRLESCDWAGLYIVDSLSVDELVLGPFCGASTEHVRISFGSGICGQVAVSKKTFIAADVSDENNYLACSPDVRSEIVIPIFDKDTFIGELDIDSHKRSAFLHEEIQILEAIAVLSSESVLHLQESMSKK